MQNKNASKKADNEKVKKKFNFSQITSSDKSDVYTKTISEEALNNIKKKNGFFETVSYKNAIKRITTNKNEEKRKNIAKVYGYVRNLYEMGIISESTRKTLVSYLVVRMDMYGIVALKPYDFRLMVENLLEKCCGKPFNEISKFDTDNNLSEIVHHLRQSIKYSRLNSLYEEIDNRVEEDKSVTKFKKETKTRRLNLSKEEMELILRGLY